jgi:glutamyl-tRNA synthetase
MKDFVIVRSNGTPVFHLANVVDDIHMGITHILRGDDHIENTYRHVALFEALGATPPHYAHFPMIVNHQGKPYSKRDGAAFIGEFREQGYSADCLLNYLSLLGWSPGDDREKMTRDELIEAFTLDRCRSSASQMDVRKLTDLNGQYLAETPLETFRNRAWEIACRQPWKPAENDAYFEKVCILMQTRTKLYTDISGWGYFFSDALDYEEKAVRKVLRKEGIREALEAASRELEACDFSEAAIEQAIRAAERTVERREGKLNQPLRVAATGISRGAGIYETLALLGRDRVLPRLAAAVKMLEE